MIEHATLGKIPDLPRNNDFENTKKQGEKRSDLPDFEKLMAESSLLVQEERNKEAFANKDGNLKIGETKSDKEFKETLEKITGKKQDKPKNKLDKDDYLNLMVTQMRYQDPTKPMENQEMATQMAQFNSVEQLVNINSALKELNTKQSENNGDKLTQYLGMELKIDGNQIKVDEHNKITKASFNLSSNSGTGKIDIKDINNKIIKTIALGTKQSGEHKLEWDGTDNKGQKVPKGQYSFNVEAMTVDGKPLQTKTMFTGVATGITNLAEGGKLETTVGIAELKNILSVKKITSET